MGSVGNRYILLSPTRTLLTVEATMQSQPKTPDDHEPLQASEHSVLISAMEYSHRVSLPEGYWYVENRCHVTITSEYVFLRQALGLELETDKEPICRYLLGD
jgi:squalene-hopene/tetraprenyl-beta-curcumene cyclase